MIKWLKNNGLMIVLAIGLIAGVKHYQAPKIDKSQPLPSFSAISKDGDLINTENFRGKYLVIDFWASWCNPCRRQNPGLVRLYTNYEKEKFKDADGFELISVGLERNQTSWLNAIEKDGLYWDTHVLDKDIEGQKISDQFNVSYIPAKFFIDPKGELIGVNWSSLRIRQYLRRKLE